jgi:Zn-dependent peptidase ImmA (M78 family)
MQAMIQHDILRWAVERAQISIEILSKKLSVKADKIEKWLNGEAKPTFKQAQNLAEKLHIPFGYLFLSELPREELPIPDFRTIRNEPTYHISPYLTELIFDLDRKQHWYREYVIDNGYEELGFVGSASVSVPITVLAKEIKEVIQWQHAFEKSKTKEDFIYELSRHVEGIGIMVMRSSYAGSATTHTIGVEELRGLAIADRHAPLIFLNSTDAKSAQVFTLAHELVHIWIGESGISDLDFLSNHEEHIEKYCNNVAAEMLVPEEELKVLWDQHKQVIENCKTIALRYYVSDFVVLKRIYDLGYIGYDTYKRHYDYLLEEWQKIKSQQKSSGGNYYNTKPAKESRRFSTAVVEATLEGKLFYRDAMALLNIKSTKTFESYAKELGVG